MDIYKKLFNLLIADDHHIILDGLSKILESEKTVNKIVTCINGQQAVDIALNEEIDCIIMDINMPVLNGLEATKKIKFIKPEIKIIVVSMLCDAPMVSKLLKAGANAFINKESGKEELLRAINKVMMGEKYLSPDISFNLYAHLSDRGVSIKESEKSLTPKEIQVLILIADGMTNKEIATKLFLSTSTIDTHRKNMLAKLELRNTAALVKYAAENRLL